jgi:GNAT superfamily N-acetyltransferase
MHRPDLCSLLEPRLPPGYQELASNEEDLFQWVSLLAKVFGAYSIAGLSEGVLSEPQWSHERVMLAAKHGRPVALSLAWEEPGLWPHSGHVYWVAVLDGHRRRGLGRYVLTRALQYFAAHGHQDAVVYTHEFRSPAINLYLELGFEPLITGTVTGERQRWQRAFSRMGRPELMAALRDDYGRVADPVIANSTRVP